MSREVVLTLPDDVMLKAESWAGLIGRPVNDFLAQAVVATVTPLGTVGPRFDMSSWSDVEVMQAADSQMAIEDDRRLSDLLDSQQAGKLVIGAHAELQKLMAGYESQLLRKACALREAVRRGLREPLKP